MTTETPLPRDRHGEHHRTDEAPRWCSPGKLRAGARREGAGPWLDGEGPRYEGAPSYAAPRLAEEALRWAHRGGASPGLAGEGWRRKVEELPHREARDEEGRGHRSHIRERRAGRLKNSRAGRHERRGSPPARSQRGCHAERHERRGHRRRARALEAPRQGAREEGVPTAELAAGLCHDGRCRTGRRHEWRMPSPTTRQGGASG